MPTTVRAAGDAHASPTGAEDALREAREEARRATEALEAESRRLEKLWDAYKAQEEELHRAVQALERLTRELAERADNALAVEATLRAKDEERQRIEDEKAALAARVAELEALADDLKALDAYKARVAELESAYETERERLAKLYLVFEELEAELAAARGESAPGA